MKVYRGPRSSKQWRKIDARKLQAWSKDWTPGKVIHVDGTIDKTGSRHTDLGIEIEVQDIAALNKAFAKYHSQRVAELEKNNKELSEAVELMEMALRKLSALAQRHAAAPSTEAFAAAVEHVANHFRLDFYRKQPFRLQTNWANWKRL
jgi:aspartyl/asparaginyl-tRNA synthetase